LKKSCFIDHYFITAYTIGPQVPLIRVSLLIRGVSGFTTACGGFQRGFPPDKGARRVGGFRRLKIKNLAPHTKFT